MDKPDCITDVTDDQVKAVGAFAGVTEEAAAAFEEIKATKDLIDPSGLRESSERQCERSEEP